MGLITNDKILTGGYRVGSQSPIDDRLVFQDIASLIDLGTSDVEAYRYYEGLRAWVLDTGREYVWSESLTGEMPTSFTYPAGIIANGVDYSGRSFNWNLTGYLDTTIVPTLFETTVSLVAFTPLLVTVGGSSNIANISLFDSGNVNITESLSIIVGTNTATLEANVNLTDVVVKVLYTT